ncbi:MAG TPA: hypothetical protein VGL55_05055 [Steroidobacteraceae bacterium]|jgi:ribosomal protein L7/L12
MDTVFPVVVLAGVLLLIVGYTLTRIERRLRGQDHKLDLLLPQAGIDPSRPTEPFERVKTLAQQPAQRIEAIRAYRQETGAELRTAVAVIDSLKSSVDG